MFKTIIHIQFHELSIFGYEDRGWSLFCLLAHSMKDKKSDLIWFAAPSLRLLSALSVKGVSIKQ